MERLQRTATPQVLGPRLSIALGRACSTLRPEDQVVPGRWVAPVFHMGHMEKTISSSLPVSDGKLGAIFWNQFRTERISNWWQDRAYKKNCLLGPLWPGKVLHICGKNQENVARPLEHWAAALACHPAIGSPHPARRRRGATALRLNCLVVSLFDIV